jgi:hypothetical protein
MKQAKVNMRQQMPETAKWVEERRAEWGRKHVDRCLRLAMEGKPDQFYAVEGGHVVGEPFATAFSDEVAGLMVKFGGKAVWMMRAPDGTH